MSALLAVFLLLQSADCSNKFDVTGRYANEDYGFEVTIPPGLTGHWNSAGCMKDGAACICMSDHGRIIPLGNHGWLEAYVGYMNIDGGDLPEKARDDYETFGIDDDEVTRVRQRFFRAARLGALPAVRFQVEYRRKGRTWIHEEIEARDEGIDFVLIYDVPKDAYAQHLGAFESLVQSWKRVPIEE